jgi:F-type H+-transporting ATPase subunit epsilon
MADNSVFTAELVTPERVLVSGPAAQVILRTADGDITFLGGHTPLVGAVEPGVVRVVSEDGEEQRVAVHGGFVQVELNLGDDSGSDAPAPSSSTSGRTRVTVLAGIAELADEIDTERARVAHDAAEARVAELEASGRTAGSGSPASASGEGDLPDPDLVEAEAALRRAEVRLEAAGVTAGAGS